MSTVAAENLKRLSETASRSLRGVASSWLNLNGNGTIAIRDSLNISSVVDNGTGDYTENFTNLMGDVNYICAGSLLGTLLTNATRVIVVAGVETTGATLKSTSQLRFQTSATNVNTFFDNAEAMMGTDGDLA